KDLEVVTQELSWVFSAGLPLESCITTLARHYQKCVSESPPDAMMCSAPCPDHCPACGLPLAPLPCQGQPLQSPVQAFTQQQWPAPASPTGTQSPVIVLQSPLAATQLPTAHQPQPGTPQALLLSDEPANSQSSLDPSSPAAELEATVSPGGDSEEEITRRAEERIKRSLREVCTEPAARLCLSEFAVVQESVQLIGAGEDAFNVQVLEDAHSVDPKGLSGCTCHFSRAFQLPCRHLLAVLSSERKTLQPEMLHRWWQKERSTHQAGRDAADGGLLEILESSWSESLDRSLLVSFLAAEVSRLLTHCSEEEFECRYRTLRELADRWIGPYVTVKL
ncbi:ZSWM1 protein, partial [Bucorvus abyssinicus]|nr:ZSWM1 protein [Bucorvus abyssinicus]